MSELRDRIAAAVSEALDQWLQARGNTTTRFDVNYIVADAVISELDLGIPCAANGCKVRRIARYHAEKSSQLSRDADDE